MVAKVVALGELSEERIAELKAQGIEVEETAVDWSEFQLPEPQYGETIIGPLTEEESRLFATYYDLSQQVEDLGREALGNMFQRIGQGIRSSDRHKSLGEAIKEGDLQFGTEEEERHFCRLQQQAGYLHAMLFYMIGERTNSHEFRIGIRSKGRAVKTGRRMEGQVQVGHMG